MILWVESASQLRLDSQEREIIWCNKQQSDSLRLRRPGQIIFVEPRRGNVLKNSGLLKVLPFRLRNSDIVCAQTRQIGLDADQLLWFCIRQRTQQGRVHHAENCGRRTNAQCHCQNGNDSNPGRFAEHPQTETYILYQNVDEIASDRFATFFLEPLMASELDPCAAFCFSAC